MRLITRLYNKAKDRKKPVKCGFLMPHENGYMATVNTITGGSVWKGGRIHSEENFFQDRAAAEEWLDGEVGENGKSLEITFVSAQGE